MRNINFYYIWYICINRNWHLINYNGWNDIKFNQTKSNLKNNQSLQFLPFQLFSAVVCMVSILPLIPNSYHFLSNPLETVPRLPWTSGITTNFILPQLHHQLFSKIKAFVYFFVFFYFQCVVHCTLLCILICSSHIVIWVVGLGLIGCRSPL